MADQLTPAALVGVQAAVALGAVVVLPLGLRLLASTGAAPVPRPRSWAWPLAGACAVVALLLPRGPLAVALSVPFALVAAVLLVTAAGAWLSPARRRGSSDLAVATGLVTTAVGAFALLADRRGATVLGFDGDILLLTVPHMLFAGFGACLAAGLAARAEQGGPSRLARAGAAGVTLGVLAVLGGYLVSDEAELVGTVVLTAGVWCATAAAWRAARRQADADASRTASRWAAVWAGVALLGSVVAMLLALWWAAGEVTDVVHPDLSWMVATHGALNALAVVLGSLVALRLRTTGSPPGSDAGPRARRGLAAGGAA